MKKYLKAHYAVFIFLAIYFGILAFKVISHPTPFFDWDESIYMQVGKEMVRHHSLIPLYQGQPWLEKPPLAPLFYGFISLLPINPDITTRVASIALSLVALWLIYAWILKVTKSKFFALAVTIFTAFNPIFFQRAQIVNTDVLLLISWLGYMLFYSNFWLSFVFLAIGVLSKSLLGFYPAILMLMYETFVYITKKNTVQFALQLKKILMQIGLLSVWYIVMLFLYGKEFIRVHFEDHLLRRVTSSIESHFGQRTFYLDIVFNEYKWFSLISFVSFGILSYQFFRKKLDFFTYFFSLFLVPWFIFLNLTKTKIDWYIYPAIPQITFLILYPLTLLQRNKTVFYIATMIVLGIYLFRVTPPLYNSYYSSYDDAYKLAMAARKSCNSLQVLVDKNDRHNDEVLQKLNLLISTSEVYGSHPSIIYYFDKPVTSFYNDQIFAAALGYVPVHACVSVDQGDFPLLIRDRDLQLIGQFGRFYLLKRV